MSLTPTKARGWDDDGLVSTAVDLAKFVPALAGRQLSGANAGFTHLTTDMDNGVGYGPGVMQRETPWGTLWGYEGSTTGFSGSMWYLPDSKITIIALANQQAAAPALTKLVDDVLALVALVAGE
ncbi:MAG: serine hydrolase [Chloroflexi bacterium]|nr:serine hydrolase [Chloroflexota bacterium]